MCGYMKKIYAGVKYALSGVYVCVCMCVYVCGGKQLYSSMRVYVCVRVCLCHPPLPPNVTSGKIVILYAICCMLICYIMFMYCD
jgi:hypothetical protein